jgi:hypothetical protein
MSEREMTLEESRQEDRRRMAAQIRQLIEEVNGGNEVDLAEAMVMALTTSHRTLQQKFLGGVRLALHKYGNLDPNMCTDLRNESAHKWAKEVAKMPNGDLRFPLI